jgi:hypothetical protein
VAQGVGPEFKPQYHKKKKVHSEALQQDTLTRTHAQTAVWVKLHIRSLHYSGYLPVSWMLFQNKEDFLSPFKDSISKSHFPI